MNAQLTYCRFWPMDGVTFRVERCMKLLCTALLTRLSMCHLHGFSGASAMMRSQMRNSHADGLDLRIMLDNHSVPELPSLMLVGMSKQNGLTRVLNGFLSV